MKKIVLLGLIVVIAGVAYMGANTYKGKLVASPDVKEVERIEGTLELDVEELRIEAGGEGSAVAAPTGISVEVMPVIRQITPASSDVTVAELAKHGGPKDCWIVYKGDVYDVTKFLPLHPGGVARIAQFCGKMTGFDAMFTRQHGLSKVNKLKNEISIPKGSLQQQ